MCLINRQRIFSPENQLTNIKHMLATTHTTPRKWHLVFFKFDANFEDFDLTYFLDTRTIQVLKKNLDVAKIYFYIGPNNFAIRNYQALINEHDIELVETPVQHSKLIKLSVVTEFLSKQLNIIFFENGCGCDLASDINLDTVNEIHTNMISYQDLSDMYLPYVNQFNLSSLIESSIMIIPYTPITYQYGVYAETMGNQLQMSNIDLATNLSLTITNLRFNCVNNICDINCSKYFINSRNPIHLQHLRENYCCRHGLCAVPFTTMCNDYLFYPYLDINSDVQLFNRDITPWPPAINTNGYGYADSSNIYPRMFKRFDKVQSGILISKVSTKSIVPHILHLVSFSDENTTDPTDTVTMSQNIWPKILRQPWQYRAWSTKELNEFMPNTRWNIFYSEVDPNIKQLAIYLAILEKHGGLVVNSNLIPINVPPDDILAKKFMISFANEANNVDKLSYQIMASVPGFLTEEEIIVNKYHAARKPFEGINNFFINAKNLYAEPRLFQVNEHDIRDPVIFDNLHQILANKTVDRIGTINHYLINSPTTLIYPSYYFNQNNYQLPKKISKRIITKTPIPNILIGETITASSRTPPNRTYVFTKESILARLNENPIDRLKNSQQL